MVNARTRTVLIESAIAAFHSEVKLGPEFVCTCCHRMMYRKSVVACNKVKYTKLVLMYFTKCSVLIIHTLALTPSYKNKCQI